MVVQSILFAEVTSQTSMCLILNFLCYSIWCWILLIDLLVWVYCCKLVLVFESSAITSPALGLLCMQGCVDLSEFMAMLDSVCPSSVDCDCEPETHCQINLLKRNRKDSLFMEEQANAFAEELSLQKEQIHTGETKG